MDNTPILQLDVENIIKSKTPKWGKRIPRFIFKTIERLVCQDRLNHLLKSRYHSKGCDFAKDMLDDMGVKVIMHGEENIPADGKFIFASNHPLGGLDGMALVHLFGEKFNRKVRFIVNDILMNVKPLATVFVPINKHGNQGQDNINILNKTFESDNQVLIFPAGLCSRRQEKGAIKDLEWKKTVITKAIEHKRDIVPVYFDGKNSDFFYNLAYYRKKFGIKANIEMILLPKEMFKNNNKTFNVYVGKPIPWQTFDKSRSHKAWAGVLKDKVYELQQR